MPAEGYSSTTIKTPVYDILKKIAKERGVSISDVIEEATIEMGGRAADLHDYFVQILFYTIRTIVHSTRTSAILGERDAF